MRSNKSDRFQSGDYQYIEILGRQTGFLELGRLHERLYCNVLEKRAKL